MVATMLSILLLLVGISVADINIDINISGEEEAAVRNTTSTVLNNSNTIPREVAENCTEKKVWTDKFLYTLTLVSLLCFFCRLG